MRFSEYPIDQAIKTQLETIGFKRPTDIQYKSITPILDGEDVFAVAQTGTGKTAAFAIPIIHKLTKIPNKPKAPICLVLAPTRELAEQIKQRLEQFASWGVWNKKIRLKNYATEFTLWWLHRVEFSILELRENYLWNTCNSS